LIFCKKETGRFTENLFTEIQRNKKREDHSDPNSVADSDPGFGVGKKSGFGSGIRIRDEQPGSYFRALKNNFLC
jgi:hypothetical protein